MIFFQIIGLTIILYSLKDYTKAFLFFLVYQLFLGSNITIVQLSGIPLLQLETFMMFWFILLYWTRRKKINTDISKFPLRFPMILLTLSYTISLVFSIAGIIVAAPQYATQLCQQAILPFLIWKVVYKHQHYRLLYKTFTICFFFICAYAIVEWIIGENPLQEYEQSLITDKSRVTNGIYGDNDFRGLRVQSVFEHPIGGGVNFALYAILIFTTFIWLPMTYKIKKMHICIAFLCIACVVLSNSRGPILFMVIGCLAFVNTKNRRFWMYAGLAICIAILVAPLFSQYFDTIMSIFCPSVRKNFVGSDENMRINQFSSAFLLMSQSPVWGIGFNFFKELGKNNILVSGLLGLESIWLWAIVQCGIFGIISHVILAYYSIIKVPRFYKSIPMFAVMFAYWVSASLTSFPGMKIGFLYVVVFLFIKQSKTYKKCIQL